MRKLSLKSVFAWLRRKLLRKRVGLLAIGIGVPWLWLMWQFFGPLSAFPVSPETTIYTEPLTPQGYVDYVKIFQDRYQHPDAKPAKEDPWCLLAGILANTPEEPKGLPKFPGISSSLLTSANAYDPSREADLMRYLTMEGLPIEAVHDFKIAANGSAAAKKFLEESEAWYSAVTMSKPTFARIEPLSLWARAYPDDYEGLHQMREVRSRMYMHQIGKPFLFRAAMHFEAGNFADGLKDLEVVYTAAKNCETYFLAGYRRALYLDQLANKELTNGLVLCPLIDEEFALRWVQAPVNLRPDEDVVKMLDERYRFESIDHVQLIHRNIGFMGPIGDIPPRFNRIAVRYAAHRLDFSELLMFQDRLIDQICEALKKSTYHEQRLSIKTIPLKSTYTPATADLSFFSHDFQSIVETTVSDARLSRLPGEVASTINSRRVLHLAVRLARWRTINGHYPDSLEVLNSIPGLPPMPEGVLIDAFSNEPFRYERVGDRYRIRSAGEDIEFNDKDDETWPVRFLLPDASEQ